MIVRQTFSMKSPRKGSPRNMFKFVCKFAPVSNLKMFFILTHASDPKMFFIKNPICMLLPICKHIAFLQGSIFAFTMSLRFQKKSNSISLRLITYAMYSVTKLEYISNKVHSVWSATCPFLPQNYWAAVTIQVSLVDFQSKLKPK